MEIQEMKEEQKFTPTKLLSFIKSDGSPLVKLIKLVVITFSIWMI